MNLKTFGFWTIVIGIMWGVVFWLSPVRSNNVDMPGWLFGPLAYASLCFVAYFAAMAHKGGFAVTWPSGHSSTAHGGVAFHIPAAGNYPELVAVPLGGGNVGGVILSGGKKAGWLIAPADQVLDLNGQLYCITDCRTVRPMELPAHVLARLRQDRLFDPRGTIAYGLLPRTDDKVPDGWRRGAPDIDKLQDELQRKDETINELDEAHEAALQVVNRQHKVIMRFSMKYDEAEEPKGIKQRLLGREEDE